MFLFLNSRYEEAVGVFLELFSSLSSSESRSCVFGDHSGIGGIQLPSVQSLHAQAIQASIDACRFSQAVQFCDHMIDKFDPPRSGGVASRCSRLSNPRPSSAQFTTLVEASNGLEIPKRSSKRLRETKDDRTCYDVTTTMAGVDDTVRVVLFDATILLYKSEALINLGSRNDSYLCVERRVILVAVNYTA